MSNDSFTFNANASGQAQVNQGQTVNATQTNNVTGELTAAKFFAAIEAETKKLPEAQQAEIKEAIEPLKEIATADTPKPIEQSTLQKYLDRLRANGPFLTRCAIAFGQPVLTKLAATDPTGVIDGLLGVAKEFQK